MMMMMDDGKTPKARDSLIGSEGQAPRKRTFFRARSAPVTGINVCTTYPNIAKST